MSQLGRLLQSRSVISVLDQGVLAAANFIALVILARNLPIEAFAAWSTVLAVWYLFESLQRAGLLLPYLARVPDPENDRASQASWFAINVSALIASIGLLVMVAFATSPWNDFLSRCLFLSSILVPLNMLWSALRRMAFHRARYRLVLASTLVYGTILVAGALVTGYARGAVVEVALAAGALAAAISSPFLFAASGVVGGKPVVRRTIEENAAFIRQMTAGGMGAYFYNNGSQLLLSAIGAPVQIAAFTATRTLVRVVSIASVAVSDADRSKMARLFREGGDERLRSEARRAQKILGATFVLPLLALAWFSSDVLRLMFGEKFVDFSAEASAWAVVLIPQILAMPLDVAFTTRGESRLLMSTRLQGAALCIGVICARHQGQTNRRSRRA